MLVIRSPKNRNYPFTQISNSFIYDHRLTPKSKAILIFLISQPDNWHFNFSDIIKFNKIGIKSIRSSIKELISTGYIFSHQYRKPNGDFDFIHYTVFETPIILTPEKTNIPAHSPFGHAINRHAHNVHPPNNKYKTTLREETTTLVKPTNSNSNVVALPYNLEKMKKTISFLKSLHIISPKSLVDKYGLNTIFKYSKGFSKQILNAENPTGFLVSSVKQRWIIPKQIYPETSLNVFQNICSICGKWFYYQEYVSKYTECINCRKKT